MENSKKLCDYGCGQEARIQFKNGKWCCSKWFWSCSIFVEKAKKMKNNGMFKKGQKIHSEEEKEKRRQRMLSGLAKYARSKKGKMSEKEKEEKRQMMLNGQAVYMNSIPRNPERIKKANKIRKIKTKNWWESHPEKKEEFSKWMKNGQAVFTQSFITNPSGPQVETWKRTCKICPYVYLNFPVTHLENSYSIDIAIPKLEIAIETDGSYWHQDKEKDLKRQQELEEDGWKFIRYKDIVPTLDQLKEDIQKLLLIETIE
jgi:hypothetical protein